MKVNSGGSILTLSCRMAAASILSKIIKWFCIGTFIIVGIFFIVDYTSSDAVDKYMEATKLQGESTNVGSKQKFKQNYLEVTNKTADVYKSSQTKEGEGSSTVTLKDVVGSGIIELSDGWYEDISSVAQGSMVVDLGDGIGLYDGLPWESEEGCYFFNTDKSTEDLYILLENTMSCGGTTAALSEKYDLQYMLGKKSIDRETHEYTYTKIAGSVAVSEDGGVVWTGSGLSSNLTKCNNWRLGNKWLFKEVDSVRCAGVCALPAAYDKNYCMSWSEEGQWHSKSNTQAINYIDSKAAVVYKKIGDVEDKFYYLPVTYGDAKAHTFPGGVVQTNVMVSNDSSYENLRVIVHGKEGIQDWEYSSLGYSMHTETSNGVSLIAYTRNVVESIGWSEEFTGSNTANSGYRIIGWAIWP